MRNVWPVTVMACMTPDSDSDDSTSDDRVDYGLRPPYYPDDMELTKRAEWTDYLSVPIVRVTRVRTKYSGEVQYLVTRDPMGGYGQNDVSRRTRMWERQTELLRLAYAEWCKRFRIVDVCGVAEDMLLITRAGITEWEHLDECGDDLVVADGCYQKVGSHMVSSPPAWPAAPKTVSFVVNGTSYEWRCQNTHVSLYDGLKCVLAEANHLELLAMLRSLNGTSTLKTEELEATSLEITLQMLLEKHPTAAVHVHIPTHRKFSFVGPCSTVYFIPGIDVSMYDMLNGAGRKVPMYTADFERIVGLPYAPLDKYGTFDTTGVYINSQWCGTIGAHSTVEDVNAVGDGPVVITWSIPSVWLQANGSNVDLSGNKTVTCMCPVENKVGMFHNIGIQNTRECTTLTIGLITARLQRNSSTCAITIRLPTDASSHTLLVTNDFFPALTTTERCMVCLVKVCSFAKGIDKIVWFGTQDDTPQPMFLETFGFTGTGRHVMALPGPTIPTMAANSWHEYNRRLALNSNYAQGASSTYNAVLAGARLTSFASGGNKANLTEFIVNRGSIDSPCITISFADGIADLKSFFYTCRMKPAAKRQFTEDLKTFYQTEPPLKVGVLAMLLVLELVKWWAVKHQKTSYKLTLDDAWCVNTKTEIFDSARLIAEGKPRDRHGYYTRFGFWPDEMARTYCRDVYCAWTATDELNYFKTVSLDVDEAEYFRSQKEQWADWCLVDERPAKRRKNFAVQC